MSDEFLKELHEDQERLGFQIFGVLIGKMSGYSRGRETLEKICQGKVVDVKDLTGPEDVRSVFGQIHSFG
jgi:hypothetical protein